VPGARIIRWRISLSLRLRGWGLAALIGLLASVSEGEERSTPITLDTSETVFSVLTALNSCGYDQDLTTSDARRGRKR